MTGTLRIKRKRDGEHYYIQLRYKNPMSGRPKAKTLSTGLLVKNNKRKAEAIIKTMIEKYSYLEELPADFNPDIDPNISLCDYMDIWLEGKERDIRKSTANVFYPFLIRLKNVSPILSKSRKRIKSSLKRNIKIKTDIYLLGKMGRYITLIILRNYSARLQEHLADQRLLYIN